MTNQQQHRGGPLPMDTPITDMLDPKLATILTSDAAKLTKAELYGLFAYHRYLPDDAEIKRLESEGLIIPKDLSIEDVQSLEKAIQLQYGFYPPGGPLANLAATLGATPQPLGSSCCCCCSTAPCCCCSAAAETVPAKPR